MSGVEHDWGGVRLHFVPPPPDLCDVISSYYYLESDLPHLEDVTRADVAHLRFTLMGGGDYAFADGSVEHAPAVCLLGPTNYATHLEMHGPVRAFGASLLPGGWQRLVGIDASDHVDRLSDAITLLGPSFGALLATLRALRDPAHMAAHLSQALRDRLAPLPESHRAFIAIADAWLAGDPSPQVDELVRRTGLSARQVARLMHRFYGGSPKLLARKYRALRGASELLHTDRDWQSVCGDAFYDQSHFIREIKRFIGMTPRQLQQSPSPLTRLSLGFRSLEEMLPPVARTG